MTRTLPAALAVLAALAAGCSAADAPAASTDAAPPAAEKSAPAPPARTFGAPIEALPAAEFPEIADDQDLASLRAAAEQSLRGLAGLPAEKALPFGAGTRTAGEVRADLEALLALLDEHDDPAALAAAVRESFIANQAAGNDGQGTVLCTGYFEPRLAGSRERTDRFRFPLYRPPPADLKGKFDRTQIDYGGALEGAGLEIVWLDDDIGRFFLHVQGSGRIDLDDGTVMRVGYTDKNGHPYRSIGKLLIAEGTIPEEEMSMQAITRYLTGKPEEIPRVFGHNPSYVFFEERDVPGPLGSIGVPLTPLRSVATDQSVFPKGALLLLRCKKPIAGPDGAIARWEPYTRLVLNQDTGGAIKGPGRVDLFCGSGPAAELTAGHMRHEGALWVLTRKP